MTIDGDNNTLRITLSSTSEVELIPFPLSSDVAVDYTCGDLFEQRPETTRLALETPRLLPANDAPQVRR